jgi:two-component system, LuxR family, response regulator FixJ
MGFETNVFLVDSDYRRRAAMTLLFQGVGAHVEPFETVGELMRHSPERSLVLLHDGGDAVSEFTDLLGRADMVPLFVCYAERPSARMVVNALRAGALDYLEWPLAAPDLMELLHSVTSLGEQVFATAMRRIMARRSITKLTRREREVLTGMMRGWTSRKIGEWLGISSRTVEIHRRHVLQKLQVDSSAGAVRVGLEGDLLESSIQ